MGVQRLGKIGGHPKKLEGEGEDWVASFSGLARRLVAQVDAVQVSGVP